MRRLSKVDKQQKEQLEYLEQLGEDMPHVNGVPICKAMTYELMQHLNNAGAKNDINK